MALSIDLRERVIAAVDGGMRITNACKVFNVCRRAIYSWLDLRKETNSLRPKYGYQRGHSHKIKDWDQFRKFAEAHKSCTIVQMKDKWQEINGETISKSVIQRALIKINYTSKKNFSLC